MRIQILDLAKEDLIGAFQFYDEKEKGLVDFFRSNLFSDIDTLKVFARIHRKPYRGFYRALSKRFPFAIYYTIENETVWIRSVVDSRRRPSWLRKHLTNA